MQPPKGLTLYSYNTRDYMPLHTKFLEEGRPHAGIILAPQQRYSIGEEMRRLLNLISARSAEEMQNQVEYLGNGG
jgi:hypothetical protein